MNVTTSLSVLDSVNAIMLMLLALVLAYLGHDWIEMGYGLNPMIAFPAATVSLVMAIAYTVAALADKH